MSDHEFDFFLNSQLAARHELEPFSRALLAGGGKRVRARLTLKIADLLQIPSAQSLPWAAANEMLHNASLVHDDIQDQDRWRRGKPTLWAEHGVHVAVSVGDYLLMKPFLLVGQIPVCEKTRFQLQQWVAETVSRMAVAQVAERGLVKLLGDAELQDRYVEVARGKTASLFELPVLGLYWLAQRDPPTACFAYLGLYFQVVDDLRDIFGQKGRPVAGEDLREGKVSAIIVSHLALVPADAPALQQFLATADKNDLERHAWRQKIAASGAIQKTLEWSRGLWQLFVQSLPPELNNKTLVQELQNWLQFSDPGEAQPCLKL